MHTLKTSLLALISVVTVALTTACASTTEAERPNILVIMTDDESAFERSNYGWSELEAPSLDRLASSGIVFENGFSSAPSCAPARAAMLTGRNFWELEQGAFIQAYVPAKFPLLPAHLEQNGYAIGRIGKGWGPGVYIDGAHPENMAGPINHLETLDTPKPNIWNRDYAASFDAFLNDKDAEQPFFYWVGIYEPHRPFGPDTHIKLEEEYGISMDDIVMPPFMPDTPEARRDRAQYLYELLYADEKLGEVLDVLEARGLAENTIVVYTADNGSPFKNAKSSSSLRGVHVPFVVRWPAVSEGGRRVTDHVTFADIAPTFIEAAQAEPMEGMSGSSFLETLQSAGSGRMVDEKNFAVNGLEWHGEFDPNSLSYRSITTDRYTLVFEYDAPGVSAFDGTEPARIKLFDHSNDPWEINDISELPESQEIIELLTEKLRANGIRTSDPRFTGDMEVFNQTRAYVQRRKRLGYTNTFDLPFTD